MDLTPEIAEQLEAAVQKLEELDPEDLPEPAADLIELLNKILEDTDE